MLEVRRTVPYVLPDDNGNILSEKRNNQAAQTLTYVYDALGQLIRANDPTENKTWTYAYDQGGNLLEKKTYAYTTDSLEAQTPLSTDTYAYTDTNWKDKLTAYNGQAITYDAIGNPLSDGTWTYTWTHGRLLASMTKPGQTIQYTYNHNGLRVKKSVNGVETHYTLRGKQIVHLTKGTTQMHFYYDGQGKPGLVTYNGNDYYYMYNLQGDVVGLTDPSNQWVVEYRYDPWGKPLACTGSLAVTLGVDNPFRYRGYVFDEETELCYLRSRYYNPATSRMLSTDPHWTPQIMIYGDSAINMSRNIQIPDYNSITQSGNMYTYCINNPLKYIDPTGLWTLAVGLVGSAAFGLKAGFSAQYAIDGKGNAAFLLTPQFGGGSPAASYCGMGTVTTASTVDQLGGWGGEAGASLGVGPGLELVFTDEYAGINVSLGFGVPLPELHSEVTYTWVFALYAEDAARIREYIMQYFKSLTAEQRAIIEKELGISFDSILQE